MPENKGSYQILSRKIIKNSFHFLNLNKRQKNGLLAMSVLGVYVLAGGVIGYIALNQSSPNWQAQASINQEATLVPAIRLVEDKEEYKLGDNVDVFVTLQNPSLVAPIESIRLEMRSAGDSILWEKAFSNGSASDDTIQGTGDNFITQSGNIFQLPSMAASERVEYLVRGTFTKQDTGLLHVDAKIDYLSNEKEQSVETYRVFTSVSEITSKDANLQFGLSSNRDKFKIGDRLALAVKREGIITENTPSEGSILVSSSKTGKLLAEKACSFNAENLCQASFDGLDQAGLYSALYRDAAGNYSNIKSLEVTGNNTFAISKKAEINTPLGVESVNGTLPIYITNIIDSNTKLIGGEICTASLTDKNKKNVGKLEAKININTKSCFFQLNANDENTQSEITFSLDNGNLSQKILLTKKPENLVQLYSTGSLNNLKSGSAFKVQADFKPKEIQNPAINNQAPTTVLSPVNMKAKMSIWQVTEGTLKEYLDIKGNKIEVVNNQLQVLFPEDFLNQEGLYKIKFEFEDGSKSDWIDVNFGSRGIGFVSSAATPLNPDTLVAGNSFGHVLNGILDKKGNSISDTGQCNTELYLVNTAQDKPINVDGSLSGDQCVTNATGKNVTKSGPATMVYNGSRQSTALPQAIQFQLQPSQASDFGSFSLAYSPAFKGFSNNILIGPVTDKFGNLTDRYGTRLEVRQADDLILEKNNLEIKNGFAQVILPSSVLTSKADLKLKLLTGQDGKEIFSKAFPVKEPTENQKLVLPNFPSVLNGDDKLKFGISGYNTLLPLDESNQENYKKIEKCNLTISKGGKQILNFTSPFIPDNASCEFDEEINKYRDDSSLLLSLSVGEYTFSNVTSIQAGKANGTFKIFGSSIVDAKDGLYVQLVSTPIVDRYGKPFEGEMTMTLNGKDRQVKVENGLAKTTLLESEFGDKDYKLNAAGEKIMSLDIDAKASSTSISSTNNIEIYIDGQTLGAKTLDLQPINSSNFAIADKVTLMEYQGSGCEAYISSRNLPTKKLNSFFYQDRCLVEIRQPEGKYTLNFYLKGLVVYTQDLETQLIPQKIIVVGSDELGYNLKVGASSASEISAEITDQKRVYRFEPNKSSGIITVAQDGLNPDQKYIVKVSYTDFAGTPRFWYLSVDGSNLVGDKPALKSTENN
jgi:hypothetical protein